MIYLSTLLKIVSIILWVVSEVARVEAEFFKDTDFDTVVPLELVGLVATASWKSGVTRSLFAALRKRWRRWKRENLWVLEA